MRGCLLAPVPLSPVGALSPQAQLLGPDPDGKLRARLVRVLFGGLMASDTFRRWLPDIVGDLDEARRSKPCFAKCPFLPAP